jgi:protein SCO1/2/putative membrane protein
MFRRLAAVLAALLLTPLCASAVPPVPRFDSLYLDPDLGPAPDFTLTDCHGKSVSRDDLKGKVWVAHFFFTECAAGCSVTTDNMARLQEQLADCPGVVLVSFTVNPTADTPERLRDYADQRKADPRRWLFLTGDESVLHPLIQNGFKVGLEKTTDARPGYQVVHSFNVMLVDQSGRIRGYVDGKSESEMQRLGRRARLMAQPVWLPAVNAVLNGTCAVLLVAGFLAIRRRRVTLHVVCMLIALGVSAVFLASYLYYHFVVLDGRPTGFRGEGFIRPVYFTILLSHTVLAAVVTPLALVTVYLGLRGRLTRHTRLARWTLPLWLYVSVTGVVVYLMLYHLYPSA